MLVRIFHRTFYSIKMSLFQIHNMGQLCKILKLEQSTIIIGSHEELDVNTACAPVHLVAPPTVQATHLLSPNHALSSTLMANH